MRLIAIFAKEKQIDTISSMNKYKTNEKTIIHHYLHDFNNYQFDGSGFFKRPNNNSY